MNELREYIKEGDVWFSFNKQNKISAIMRWFMRSKWSHCGIVKEISEQDIYTIETSDKEVWIGRFKEYLNPEYDWELWRPVGLSKESKSESVGIASNLLETMYGYIQLLGFALRCTLQRFNLSVPNFIRQGVVCCGVVFYAYQNKLKGFDVDPESRHTQDLYEIVLKSDEWVMIAKKEGSRVWLSSQA